MLRRDGAGKGPVPRILGSDSSSGADGLHWAGRSGSTSASLPPLERAYGRTGPRLSLEALGTGEMRVRVSWDRTPRLSRSPGADLDLDSRGRKPRIWFHQGLWQAPARGPVIRMTRSGALPWRSRCVWLVPSAETTETPCPVLYAIRSPAGDRTRQVIESWVFVVGEPANSAVDIGTAAGPSRRRSAPSTSTTHQSTSTARTNRTGITPRSTGSSHWPSPP